MNRVVCVPVPTQAPARRQPPAGTPVIIAVDVSRARWVYCIRWGGQPQRQLSTPGTLEHLQALGRDYAECVVHVVYEACGFGYEIAWWARAQGWRVTVVAPCTVERAPGRRVKTDRLDAAALAAKADQGQLKGIYIPDRALHEQRQVLRTYLQLRQDQRRHQTRIRSVLQEHGRLGPAPHAGWPAYARWLREQVLPAPLNHAVNELLEQRRSAEGARQRLKAELLRYGASAPYAPVVSALRAQAGIGPFSAIWLALELADIRRFAGGAALVHYLGLVPNEYSSGPRVCRGHLLKCGPGAVRALLVECAWRSLRAPCDPRLRAYFQRLCPRLERKRAIIAVTRRVVLQLHARWTAALAAAPPTA